MLFIKNYWLNHYLFTPSQGSVNEYVQYANGTIGSANQIGTLSTDIVNASRFNNLSDGSPLIVYFADGDSLETTIDDITFNEGGPLGPPSYLITITDSINYEGSDVVGYGQIVEVPEDNATATIVSNSGLGARCKVEIISKSDLLRARGFKVNGD